jgi:hypothetical protein
MSARNRAILIIVCTLLLGVAIGTLIVAPLVARHHFRRLAEVRTPGGFVARLEELIDPDPGQAPVVREILTRYGERIDEIASRHRDEAKAVFDSLEAELASVLTDQQKERLDRMKHRAEDHGPGEHGPGPPRRPK